MQPLTRRILLSSLVLVLSGLTSGGIYAFATTFLNHQVAVSHFQGAGAGFTDDTGLWAIMPNPYPNSAGLEVFSHDIGFAGTSQSSPATFFSTTGQFPNEAFMSNGAAAGNWVLGILITNTTSVPASTTWSFGIVIFGSNILAQSVTLYFQSSPAPSPGNYEVAVFIGLSLGQSLPTPISYTAVVRQVS